MADNEIWLADLTKCAPAEAISRDGSHGTWISVDYEVDAGSGVMLFALPDAEAPPLTLRLNAEGWHEIRIGVYYGTHAGFLEDRMLSQAQCRSRLQPYRPRALSCRQGRRLPGKGYHLVGCGGGILEVRRSHRPGPARRPSASRQDGCVGDQHHLGAPGSDGRRWGGGVAV